MMIVRSAVVRAQRLVLLGLGIAALAGLVTPAAAQDWRGPVALQVDVDDSRGRALAGAEVKLVYLAPAGGGALPPMMSDTGGRVSVSGLAAGRWMLEVRHATHMTYRAEIAISADTRPAVLSAAQEMVPGATGTLRVKLSRGKGGAPPPVSTATFSPVTPLTPAAPPPTPPPVAPSPAATPSPVPQKPAPAPAPTIVAAKPAPAPGATQAPAVAPAKPATAPASTPPASAPAPAPVAAPAPTTPAAAVAPPAAKPTPVPATAPAPVAPPAATAAKPTAPPATAPAPAPAVSSPPAVTPGPSQPKPAPAPATTPAPSAVKPAPPTTSSPTTAVPPPPAKPATTPVVAPAPPAPAPALATPPPPVAASAPSAPAPAAAAAPAPAAVPASAPDTRRARLCVECKPGESAQWGEARIESGAATGCPADLRQRLEVVPLYGGAELAALGATLGDGCRAIRVDLPEGARFTGFRYEASGGNVSADCLPERACPAGGARFPFPPVIRKEGGRTILLVGFESAAPEPRSAVVAGYYSFTRK